MRTVRSAAIHRIAFATMRAYGECRSMSRPVSGISGTYLTKVINKHAAPDALVCCGRRNAAGLDGPPY